MHLSSISQLTVAVKESLATIAVDGFQVKSALSAPIVLFVTSASLARSSTEWAVS